MTNTLLATFSLLFALLVNEPGKAFSQSPIAAPAYYYSSSERQSAIGERLQQEFRESFPDAEKISWQESDNGYLVSFVQKGMPRRISYKRNGEFISAFRNYGERELPYYLVNSLKKKYPGQRIFGVTEISTISDISYFVKLEGPRRWITVTMSKEGDWFVTDSYRKQN
ncbi:MAG TPA: hypothetical protein VL727_09340 [Puia sp.]|jgi:hypothetical protein|nr:hypothetical protein [Puia sp.]